MARTRFRFLSCLFATFLAFPFPSAAFDTPLSDTAVRQAYFMGQRHDESLGRFLDKYIKHLRSPKTGPYISSVTFFTPYALLAQLSSQHAYGYSAQQAEIEHRHMVETVQVIVEIQLTDTYPAFIPTPTGQTTGTPWDYIARPSNFWQDFQIQVISDKKTLSPFKYSGEPSYICGDSDVQALAPGERCTLVGATVQLEFLADAFAPGSATIEIDPPEGDQVTVDFDLSSFR
jgi:hypothetical protein